MPEPVVDVDHPDIEIPHPRAGAERAPASRSTSRLTGRQLLHLIAVGMLTLGAAVAYCAFGVLRQRTFHTATVDLGYFDQAIRGYAHFTLPHIPSMRMLSPSDPGAVQLGDHFSPILALLAPLYWIHDSASTLQIAQGVLFALAIPPLWIYTRRTLGTPAAYLVAVGFAASWELQEAVAFDFHEVAFAVPLLAWMLERLTAGRIRTAVVLAVALLLVKEDMGFVVAMLGIYLAWQGRRRLGAALAVGGLMWSAVVMALVMPAFGGSAMRNFTYRTWGPNPVDALWGMVHNPLAVLETLLAPEPKVHLLIWLVVPLFGLMFTSRLAILVIPLLVERLLSDNANWWTLIFQYNAYLVPILFFAAVDGASRLPRPRVSRPVWATAVCAFAVVTLHEYPLWGLAKAATWQTATRAIEAREAALHQIPSGVLVAADATMAPHLEQRDKVVQQANLAVRPAYVIGHPGTFGPTDPTRFGYAVTYDRDGWEIYRHVSLRT